MRLIDADALRKLIHCAYSDDLEILEKIDAQPTIEIPTWIPITEETPPDETDVIVTIQDDTGDRPFRYTATAWYFKGTWVGNNEIIHNVIAWMPLPKPYEVPDAD